MRADTKMRQEPVRALLFDLGGVLLRIDFGRVFAHWQRISALSLPELRAAFAFDEAYDRHERGEISGAEYFAHIRDRLQLQDDLAHIEAGWNAIFAGTFEETTALVRRASAQVPCAVFTNTNQTHHALWSRRHADVLAPFGHVFVSSVIGMRKPERAAFEHVAATLGVPIGSVLFFDDLGENVDGARAAGMQAVLVRGPEDVRHALADLGIHDA
jgi:putative hydrolase of the HAD superfamily